MSKARILVVDDDRAIGTLVGGAFAALGLESYSVIHLRDAESAWQLIQNNPGEVAAILLDGKMPGMSGYDLFLKMLRELHEVPPCVYIGADPESDTIPEATAEEKAQLAAMPWLGKPFSPKRLADLVKQMIATDPRSQRCS